MDPWRYSTEGISVALRVTPRGGRDDIDGIETLANGRSVVKVRVRAIANGGEANRAVTELLAKALGVPKASVKILSGATSRLKQVAIGGVQRFDGRAGNDDVHYAVVDEWNRFGLAGSQAAFPGEFETAHILLVDLVEGAVALRVVGAAVHQPVVGAGVHQHFGGDGLEVLDLGEGRDRQEEEQASLHISPSKISR